MKALSIAIFVISFGTATIAQEPTPTNQPTSQAIRSGQAASFDLREYGVRIQPEPRLIVMMAALDAAGFDPSRGSETSSFRAELRKDQVNLDDNLRARLRAFYQRYKLPEPATPGEQIARYVSLALALGAPPYFDSPARTEELPTEVLEVLDFAPMLREFYKQSGIAQRLTNYQQIHQAEGDKLRRPTMDMVRLVLSYLHTRPITTSVDRVPVTPTGTAAKKKKEEQQKFTLRERARRFFIVPDLLAPSGAINFRIIADDYYAIVPPGTNPVASELRRAYLQYVVDSILVRYNRQIAERREAIRQLMTDKAKSAQSQRVDIFTAVGKSFIAAADALVDESSKLQTLLQENQKRLANASPQERDSISKENQSATQAIRDETVALLSDAYENGAVLSFYFAEQLRDLEASGFDVVNFFPDMIASFDPAKERERLTENAPALQRALAARQARLIQRSAPEPDSHQAQLIQKLFEVEAVLRAGNYKVAEARLIELLKEFPGEPRIFLALGNSALMSARDSTDEALQIEKLNQALSHYRMTIRASSQDTDRALLSRAHEAMGRILAALNLPEEAMEEFDAAIALQDVPGGAYQAAVEGKKRLSSQR